MSENTSKEPLRLADVIAAGQDVFANEALINEEAAEHYEAHITRLQDFAIAKILDRLGADIRIPRGYGPLSRQENDARTREFLKEGMANATHAKEGEPESITESISATMDTVIDESLDATKTLHQVNLGDILREGRRILSHRDVLPENNTDAFNDTMVLLTRYASAKLLERAGVDTAIATPRGSLNEHNASVVAAADLLLAINEQSGGDRPHIAAEIARTAVGAMDTKIDRFVGPPNQR